jgi:D-methionine transport system permease protein
MITPADFSLALQLIPKEFLNTVYMVVTSTFFSLVIGLPLGVILRLTDRGGLKENPFLYRIFGAAVNIGRSIPFAILMIALIPLTRWIVGTSVGTTASIVPLSLAAAPFMARVVESALKEINGEVIDAALVMGSSTDQIVRKVLFPEALPGLFMGLTLTMVNLVGYSAMAGLVGGGGLGKIAIQYGYHRFNGFLMIATLLILLLLVEGIEGIGKFLVRKIHKKRGFL